MNKNIGNRRTVWLPHSLESKAEEVRKNLGLGKSAFYRFAIVEIVKQYQTKQFKHKKGEHNEV